MIRNSTSPILEGEPVKNYALNQNYPNPFNPETVISYALPQTGYVVLKIYDINGREAATLVNEIQSKGRYSVRWNAGNVSSGIYVYTLSSGSYKESKLMLLTK